LVRVKWGLVLYQVVSAVVLLFILFFTKFDSSVGQTQQFDGITLLVYVPKIVLLVFMLGEDIFRVGAGSIN
jgi:hypothetical protein